MEENSGAGEARTERQEQTEQAGQTKQAGQAKQTKAAEVFDPAEVARSVEKGVLKLEVPIQDGDKTYDQLEYDFNRITGIELATALDYGSGPKDAFRITGEQALNYFAVAAAKCQKPGGIDKTDIMRGFNEPGNVGPTVKAIQVATLFFRSISRAADRLISKA